jgi:hypothetical protein
LCTAKNRFSICRKRKIITDGKRTRRGCYYYCVKLRTGFFVLQKEQNQKRWKEDKEAYERIKEGIPDTEEDHLDLDLR